MSCNGCRVLRKGCSESCVLRPCLQWIQTPEAQGHATVFVAKFFGRAGLMSFIANVPESHRPALFQSLLYEACGRTVNPVSGAVGLLWTGNWHLCEAAVQTVLHGGVLRPIPELLNGIAHNVPDSDEASEVVWPNMWRLNQDLKSCSNSPPATPATAVKRRKFDDGSPKEKSVQLDLRLTKADVPVSAAGTVTLTPSYGDLPAKTVRRPATPSLNSEESGLTISFESGFGGAGEFPGRAAPEPQLLNLFV